MNTTVKRIVEIMFQDAEETEEVVAARDEVMNNCQEHYDDLVRNGVSEDDAIAAVVESLKGMEEIVRQHPQKAGKAEASQQPEQEDQGATFKKVFPADKIRAIAGKASFFSIHVQRAEGTDVIVEWDKIGEKPSPDDVSLQGDGTLHFDLTNKNDMKSLFTGKRSSQGFADPFKDVQGFFSKLGDLMTRAARGVDFHFNSSPVITFYLPDGVAPALNAHTTSGDIRVDGVSLAATSLGSTSGDVNVNVEECANALNISTTSGDIHAEGSSSAVALSSVSGDIMFGGMAETVALRSVSGDIMLEDAGGKLRNVQAQSTSGDLMLRLNSEAYQVLPSMHTVSGDKRNQYAANPNGVPLALNASSISGDIFICARK